MPDETRTLWKHRKGDTYAVLFGPPQGNPEQGFWFDYRWLSAELQTHAQAVREGFKVQGSDDFNIGAIRDGKLAAVLWMHEVCDDAPDVLAEWEATRP